MTRFAIYRGIGDEVVSAGELSIELVCVGRTDAESHEEAGNWALGQDYAMFFLGPDDLFIVVEVGKPLLSGRIFRAVQGPPTAEAV
jgi:hypothetical protein